VAGVAEAVSANTTDGNRVKKSMASQHDQLCFALIANIPRRMRLYKGLIYYIMKCIKSMRFSATSGRRASRAGKATQEFEQQWFATPAI
ncbi:MAG: hypothetical protein WBQ69_01280, partial [Gallionella sp.]